MRGHPDNEHQTGGSTVNFATFGAHFETMSLLTVGTVAFDSIETPFGSVDNVIGGAATYIAWAASYLTRPIQIVSIIGGDFPLEELTALRERGVDLTGIKQVPDGKSFYWAGRYHDNMISRDTLTTDLNVLADFDPVLPEAYRSAEYLMLGNLTPDIQRSVIEQMSKRPNVIALDTMNFWMDTALESLLEVLRLIDILIINDEEARQLSGEYSLVKAASAIQEMGPRFLVIKKGEHGALLFSDNRVFFAPGLPLLEVVDPTGAGDTFAGGFIGHIARTGDTSFENMRRAVIYGSVMASFCVEDFSLAKLRNLSDDEIERRYQEFRDLVHF
ncbi:MAG: PfkB family carbohydrate kinase [Saprospiraceae bacterium]|nr:PfkB family carbohydrate kinase [Saprospiraceae bacterium]